MRNSGHGIDCLLENPCWALITMTWQHVLPSSWHQDHNMKRDHSYIYDISIGSPNDKMIVWYDVNIIEKLQFEIGTSQF